MGPQRRALSSTEELYCKNKNDVAFPSFPPRESRMHSIEITRRKSTSGAIVRRRALVHRARRTGMGQSSTPPRGAPLQSSPSATSASTSRRWYPTWPPSRRVKGPKCPPNQSQSPSPRPSLRLLQASSTQPTHQMSDRPYTPHHHYPHLNSVPVHHQCLDDRPYTPASVSQSKPHTSGRTHTQRTRVVAIPLNKCVHKRVERYHLNCVPGTP